MSSMEAAQKELQTRMEGIVEKFAVDALPAQKKAVQCSLDCFSTYQTPKEVASCGQRCQKPFEELSQVANKEFGGVQNQVRSCQQGCMSKLTPQLEAIRAGLSATPSEEQQKQMQLDVDSCATQCMRDALDSIGGVETRLQGYLKNMGA